MNARQSPTVTVLTATGENTPPGLEALHEQADVFLASDESDLNQHLPNTDVLLVTDFRTEALEAAWHKAEQLQWIHAASAGVDALMFPALSRSDIPMTNARGIFDQSIAEYVLGVILMFAKDSRTNIELQQANRWQHRNTERIQDKQMLVVGAGSIGRSIAKQCGNAGMRVAGIARHSREDDAFEAIHPITELHQHLATADYVVIAAPLTPDTKGLFGTETFAAMPSHARLINIGRGAIVDTNALLAALDNGEIAGAGLDVFETEPLPADHPLWDYKNVLISAHMAGDFIGWRTALSQQFLDNFARWQRGEALHNMVNKQRGYVPPARNGRSD